MLWSVYCRECQREWGRGSGPVLPWVTLRIMRRHDNLTSHKMALVLDGVVIRSGASLRRLISLDRPAEALYLGARR